MHPQSIARYTKRVVIVAIVLMLAYYAVFQSRNLLSGATLAVEYPKNGATVYESPILVEGYASNISKISLNDRPIFVDSNGEFKEKLLLSLGYNVIVVKVWDKFGKISFKKIEIVHKL